MCGSAVAALGANQGPWEPTMVPGSQPMPLKATHGPWDPTKAPFFSQDGNLRHFPPFWTTILDYALGAEKFCIFALGAGAAFSWCLFQRIFLFLPERSSLSFMCTLSEQFLAV